MKIQGVKSNFLRGILTGGRGERGGRRGDGGNGAISSAILKTLKDLSRFTGSRRDEFSRSLKSSGSSTASTVGILLLLSSLPIPSGRFINSSFSTSMGKW